jgi:hypothetical protein
MHETPSSLAWLWWLLPLLPVAAALVLLVPPLGEREQGLLPELLAPGVGEAGQVAQLTRAVRWFGGIGFAVACLAGAGAAASVALAWRSRLRTLDPARASGFRALVHRRLGLGVAAALVLGAALLACSPARSLPAAWAGLLSSFALASAGQSAATVFGVRVLRRLYRGGLS